MVLLAPRGSLDCSFPPGAVELARICHPLTQEMSVMVFPLFSQFALCEASQPEWDVCSRYRPQGLCFGVTVMVHG